MELKSEKPGDASNPLNGQKTENYLGTSILQGKTCRFLIGVLVLKTLVSTLPVLKKMIVRQ